MEDQLCDTVLTGNILQDLLTQSSHLQVNGHRLRKVEAKTIGENRGFTSRVLRVSLDWGKTSTLPQSVIVKVIGGGSAIKDAFGKHMSEEHMEKMQSSLNIAHNVECKVYELDGLQKAVPMPRCYGFIRTVGTEPGIIVLEDLSDSAITISISSWGIGLARGQVDEAIDALSSLHAWSVNDTNWRKTIPSLVEENVLAPLYESLLLAFPQSKAAYPEHFKRLDEETFKKKFNNDQILALFGADPKVRYNLPLVLVHGDVHVMNMLFKKNSDENAPEKLLALIDWQVAHQGCGMEDVARLFFLALSTEMRRAEGDNVLRKYVQLFNGKVKSAENRVTFEDCKKALDEAFSYFAILWSCGMALMSAWDELLKDMNKEEKDALVKRMMDFYFTSLDDALTFFGW